MNTAWFLLIVAGLFEIAWAVGLRFIRDVEGTNRVLVIAATAIAMAISVILLGVAMQKLPLGTSYAVWTGIGAAGTAVLGLILFHEPATALRLACIALIILGVAGLRLAHVP